MTARLYAAKAPPSLQDLPASRWLNELDDYTRERILKQRNPQDAATRLCTHRLLRYALQDAYDLDAQTLRQVRTPAGKPVFTAPGAPHFSLSHSGAVALCAVHEAPVGADVERIRPIKQALAKRIMSGSEWASFQRSNDHDGFFFRIWTLKESFLKQTGQGIASGLRNLSFTLDGAVVTFNMPGYAFGLYTPADGYQAAVCLASGALPAEAVFLAWNKLDVF